MRGLPCTRGWASRQCLVEKLYVHTVKKRCTVQGNSLGITLSCTEVPSTIIQGGSDKSGILKIFLENHTAQLKIIRFY